MSARSTSTTRRQTDYVTNAELHSELRSLRWEMRFIVVLALLAGQAVARFDFVKGGRDALSLLGIL